MERKESENNSGLLRHLIKTKAFLSMKDEDGQSQKGLETTHLLYSGFNGGCIHVKDQDYPKFLELYAQDIIDGYYHAISQQRSEVFKMYIDNDFLLYEPITKSQIIEFAHIYQKQIARFFPETTLSKQFDVIILTVSTDPIAPESNSEEYNEMEEENEEENENNIDKLIEKDIGQLEDITPSELEEFINISDDSNGGIGVNLMGSNNSIHSSSLGDNQQEEIIRDDSCSAVRIEQEEQEGEKEETIKFGIHFIFPNLYVTSHMALMFRETFLCYFRKEYGTHFGAKPWTLIVDQRVYTFNGLRMAHCGKHISCPTCKGTKSKKATCSTCTTSGKIRENRIYTPCAYLRGESAYTDSPVLSEQELKFIQENIYQCIRKTSIWLPKGAKSSSGFIPYVGAPLYDLKESNSSKRSEKKGVANKVAKGELLQLKNGFNSKSETGGSATTGGKRITVPEGSPKFICFQAFVNKYMGSIYESIEAYDIYCNNKCTYYIMRTTGEGKNYCQNIEGDHVSSSIYFLLTPKGIQQKCWCRCETEEGRKYGMCKDYASTIKPIPGDMREMFFPEFTKAKLCGRGNSSSFVITPTGGNPQDYLFDIAKSLKKTSLSEFVTITKKIPPSSSHRESTMKSNSNTMMTPIQPPTSNKNPFYRPQKRQKIY